jgi:hypothetical protein
MKKNIHYHIVFIFITILIGCTNSDIYRTSQIANQVITPELMKKHIYFLASDSMKGRNTPSPELDSAARYIAGVFQSCGLQPVNGSYFEKVGLSIVSLGEDNYLRIAKDSNEQSYKIKTEFTPFDMTGNNEVKAQIVFAGYGITAPDYKYDDYKDIDVHGKIVIVLKHEPGENDSSSIFNGVKETEYSNVSEKVKNAIDHGAIGVLVATDPLNHESLTPRGFPWPTLSKFLPKDALPISLAADEKKKVPVVHVGEEVINQLFGSVDSLKKLQETIDSKMAPHSFEINGISISVKTSTSIKDMSSQNVVGYLEGSDPKLKNELLIIGGHYDHVGYMKQHKDSVDYIYNGADDNSSGTSSVMAIAEAFGKMPMRSKRSVLFMAFAGEEKGLFGSRCYVNQPLFPLGQTVAMLNLDMEGRNSVDSLYMVSEALSPDLAQINREENKEIGFTLIDEEKLQGGSDHMSFQKKKIPFLFYFAGMHPDVHQVTDEPEKINTIKAAKAARLAFRTAWRIANEDKKYHLIENPKQLQLF